MSAQRKHRIRPLLLVPLLPLLLGGCLQYRSTGAMLDDQNIELRVIDAIYGTDAIGTESHIKVEVYENTVLLMGETPTEANKTLAGKEAAGVERVERVVNEIEVRERAGTGARFGNSWLSGKVNMALDRANTLEGWDAYRVKVVSSQGTVFLMGNLTRAQGDAVAEVVRNVRGVDKVVKVFSYTESN